MQNNQFTSNSGNAVIVPADSFRRHLRRAGIVFACLGIFLSAVLLYSRQNNFSSVYHPDEYLKGIQLLTNKRLYLHPPLLLEGTELGLKISQQQPAADKIGVRQVILTGRWVSAVFAALSVVAFALIGYGYGGFAGFWLTGLSVGLCPSILLSAHFMKEDTALLLGLAITLLALLVYSKAATRRIRIYGLVFVGAAAGIAVSGKYIGIVALIAGLAFVLLPVESPNAFVRAGLVLLGFVVATVLINYRIFVDWSAFKGGLGYEVNRTLSRQSLGTIMNRPNLFAMAALFRETMPHVLALAGAFAVLLGLFWRKSTTWDLFLVLFALGYSVMLSFSVVPVYRYNLPVIALLHLMAALAVIKYTMVPERPRNWAVVLAGIALIVLFQARRCRNYLEQFANDSHVQLRSFIAQNVPRGFAIAADAYAIQEHDDDPRLAESERQLPVRLTISYWVADLGDYDALRATGVDLIAVSESAFGRFFDSYVWPSPNDTQHQRRRRFYEQLFAQGELVWASDPDLPTYSFINPELRLYRVSRRSR